VKADWPKSPEALVARFWNLVPEDDRVQRKKMFGYPCAVIGGNMFMSLHGDRLVLRLPEDQMQEALKREGCVPFEPMPGRPMKGYVAVAPDVLDDAGFVSRSVDSAFSHTAAIPAKERQPPRRH
jgi:hypothetical protein